MSGIENSRADARLFDTSRFAGQIEKVLASGRNGKAPVITLSSEYAHAERGTAGKDRRDH